MGQFGEGLSHPMWLLDKMELCSDPSQSFLIGQVNWPQPLTVSLNGGIRKSILLYDLGFVQLIHRSDLPCTHLWTMQDDLEPAWTETNKTFTKKIGLRTQDNLWGICREQPGFNETPSMKTIKAAACCHLCNNRMWLFAYFTLCWLVRLSIKILTAELYGSVRYFRILAQSGKCNSSFLLNSFTSSYFWWIPRWWFLKQHVH